MLMLKNVFSYVFGNILRCNKKFPLFSQYCVLMNKLNGSYGMLIKLEAVMCGVFPPSLSDVIENPF